MNLSVFTWNARALLMHDVITARQKWSVVRTACLRYEVVCIQEARGTQYALELATQWLSATHHGFFSAGAAADTGGLITWIARDKVQPHGMTCHELVPGRVSMVHATRCHGARLTVVNIHNVAVPVQAIRELAAEARRARADARHMFVMAGDYNFEEVDEPDEEDPLACRVAPRGDSERRRWLPVLRVVTAHSHGHATRFGATDEGTQRNKVSGLDRVYSALPPYRLAYVRVVVQLGDARVLDRRGHRAALSDHRPIATIWTTRRPLPPHARPIPEWVVRSADFADDVSKRLREAGLDCLPIADALRRAKQIIRTSAARARNALLSRDPRAKLSKRHAALQAMRALGRGDVGTLRRTQRETPELASAVHIDPDSREAIVHDEERLHKFLADAITQGNACDAEPAAATHGGSLRRSRRAGGHTKQAREKAMRRWAGLWAPRRQRRWLAGVTLAPDGEEVRADEKVVTGECDIARALADFWATRFAEPHIDKRLAGAMAMTFVPALPGQRWPVPTIGDAGKALRIAKPTSVGRHPI